ncbi:MAG: hypothetical protein DHS20C11_28760 [Lysobacteraceae bacterium]|nr:MAG: hypothetical protein DHS20C11_28760 [Xanthomonadaceae bacterium]
MAKSIFYKLFGLRKLPAAIRSQLQNEGIVFDQEGTSCALSFRNFRGPRNASYRGWEGGHSGSLVISRQTFYVQFPYMLVCNKPIDFAVKHIELDLKSDGELMMKFDVERLFDDATGELTCLWRTTNAAGIRAHLQFVARR